MRPLQIGDEFALADSDSEDKLPPLPEGLNWARGRTPGNGLQVYQVVKCGSAADRVAQEQRHKVVKDIVTVHENGPPEQYPPEGWANDAITTILTTDKNARKNTPIFSGCLRYFPKALAAVAALSQIGNEQHNPGTPLHWDRSKSGDEWDALTRHLLEVGTHDTDGVRHSAKVAWRALAGLQKELEDSERTDARPRDPTADAGRGPSCDEGELGPGC